MRGISGASTRLAERPEGKRCMTCCATATRWACAGLTNYTDVVDAIREFMRRRVIVQTVINGMSFDGSTTEPMQVAVRDALIAFPPKHYPE
jgi:putative DNA-invertase from lambdoid prophage Rac